MVKITAKLEMVTSLRKLEEIKLEIMEWFN